jgi:uncharacterized protein HemX
MTDNTTLSPEADLPPESTKPKTKSTGRGVWWVMWFLLLLVLLLGGAGYWGYGQWQLQHQSLTALQNRVAELDGNLNTQLNQRAKASELGRLTEETQSTQHALQLAVAGLQTALKEHKQRLDSLNQKLGQDASQWRLSEIERLLAAAQLRIGALDDPIGARQMLREVERLAASIGGESLALRNAVQQLAGALDSSVPLDRDGLALKMFNLAQIMPNLPLKAGELAASSATAAQQADWWAQTKAWFGSWMTVKNTAQPAAIMPDANRPAPLAEATQTLLKARAALLTRHVDEAARLSAQALTQAQQVTTLDSASPKVQQAMAQLRDIAAALEQGYRPQALDFAPAFAALRALSQPVAAPESAPAEPTQTKEP